MNKQIVLITGGNGLVGSSLKDIVNNQFSSFTNYTFVFISRRDGDLSKYDDVKKIFTKHRPNIVIHLASRVGGVYENMKHNYEFFHENILINLNILEACRQFRITRLINILSTCIFPDKNVTYPLTSEQLHNGKPHDSNIGYAYSKRILDIGGSLLGDDMDVINLIPTNLYGENDNYHLEQSHVIPALIHKFYIAMIENEQKIHINGSGFARRQFVYSYDLARIILHFISTPILENKNIIISPPEQDEMNIRELVNKIAMIYNYKGRIIYDANIEEGQIKKTVSNNELRTYIPNFNFTPITIGLENVIKYFDYNYHHTEGDDMKIRR